jgi:3-(methylthio)propanoyl-CoA dehydrogenase
MLTKQNDLMIIQHRLVAASQALEAVVNYVVENIQVDIKGVFAGSVPYLKLAGIVLAGWQMAYAALIAWQKSEEEKEEITFYNAKIITARFFADHFLSQADGYRVAIMEGSTAILALSEDQF